LPARAKVEALAFVIWALLCDAVPTAAARLSTERIRVFRVVFIPSTSKLDDHVERRIDDEVKVG
jgi:hypothetical protein